MTYLAIRLFSKLFISTGLKNGIGKYYIPGTRQKWYRHCLSVEISAMAMRVGASSGFAHHFIPRSRNSFSVTICGIVYALTLTPPQTLSYLVPLILLSSFNLSLSAKWANPLSKIPLLTPSLATCPVLPFYFTAKP